MAATATEAYDFTLEVPDIDGDLVMELLEESDAENNEGDKLGCVIRSLEAEIGGSESIDFHNKDCEDCRLDGILSDADSHDCSGSSTSYMMAVDDPFDWVEMGDDMGGWYMEEAGIVGYGDQSDYGGGIYYGESSMEQPYIPLWQ